MTVENTATTFDVTMEGKVAHLQLNRPDTYNAMTREFWSELPAAVRALDEDGSVRAIVISSTGKHFCAGMDLAVFTGGGGGALGGPSADGSRAEEGRVRARPGRFRFASAGGSWPPARLPSARHRGGSTGAGLRSPA